MKILSIVGARPQFIKAAVFRKYCDEHEVEEILLHTGQHYDPEMSTKIFSDLKVRAPDISHSLKARTHGGMTGEILECVESAICKLKPDFVNVFGDTNSTLGGALAASKLHVPVIHIEAGLRSFNKSMPEEINRVITDHISDYLFCPTQDAVKNLHDENIKKGVHLVGDIMYDAVKIFEDEFLPPSNINTTQDKPLAVMTVHRADTTENPEKLRKIIEFCKQFAETYDIIFPAHPNTSTKLNNYSIDLDPIQLIQPLPYIEMQGLLKIAQLVLTDSGGLQKEAYFHGCDCITLRDETEWIETINSGWNRLWNKLDEQPKPKKTITDYGNGNVCELIFKQLYKNV